MSLDLPIQTIKGLTRRQTTALKSLDIRTVGDLLWHFPFRHDDFTKTVPIAQMMPGDEVTLVAKVTAVRNRRSFKRRLTMTEAVLQDGTGQLTALWFHQPYLTKTFLPNQQYRFAGKLSRTKAGLRLVSPLYELDQPGQGTYTLPFVPVYPLASGISQPVLRKLVMLARQLAGRLTDPLPPAFRRKHGLVALSTAVRQIHFPKSKLEIEQARQRLGFDELLRLQLTVGAKRQRRGDQRAEPIPFDAPATKRFVDSLPFRLTDDQRRAAWEIIQDLERDRPMQRLLDGDVGSGKTAVAAVALEAVCRAGRQGALMAPTEILAKQHFDTLRAMLAEHDIDLALWTNSYKRHAQGGRESDCSGRLAKRLAEDITAGEIGIVVGTHALIEETVNFARLTLAIIDEQHRFGVRVRRLLCRKGGLTGVEPHLLSMTATPIPRSLALTVFGDLDLSLIRERPGDRKPVVTRVVPSDKRAEVHKFVRQQLAAGRQAFVICPAIEESDKTGMASVEETHDRLAGTVFADVPVAKLHGRLSAEEKEAIMADFLSGRTKILVSTSVIEVGVDVPNAAVMWIEGAERFGLAQLHQFRGRVGRGEHQSYCLLFPNEESGPETLDRLRVVARTADGFALAEKDLELRGPGDLLGQVQHGLPPFRVARLTDTALVRQTRRAAADILDNKPAWSRTPEFAARYSLPERDVHLE